MSWWRAFLLALHGPDTDMDTGKCFRSRGDPGPRLVVGY